MLSAPQCLCSCRWGIQIVWHRDRVNWCGLCCGESEWVVFSLSFSLSLSLSRSSLFGFLNVTWRTLRIIISLAPQAQLCKHDIHMLLTLGMFDLDPALLRRIILWWTLQRYLNVCFYTCMDATLLACVFPHKSVTCNHPQEQEIHWSVFVEGLWTHSCF